jgi:hypothetical protein
MSDNIFDMLAPQHLVRRVQQRCQLFFPLRAIEAGPPVFARLRFPGQPRKPRAIREQIHGHESFVFRKLQRACPHDKNMIGFFHHRFRHE